jgi:YidC/Oxa1 family membrane protein insertase
MEPVMDENHRNTILAIVLSVVVLIGWQYFFGLPQVEKQKQQQQQAQQQAQPGQVAPPGQPGPSVQQPAGGPVPGAAPQPATGRPGGISRDEALKLLAPREPVETARVRGSLPLKSARIDDIALRNYHVTVDPKSPNILLLSPSGAPEPFYVEFGWVGASGSTAPLPGPDTLWSASRAGALTPTEPLVLTWDNGAGLKFRRTVAVDRDYMFTINEEVENAGAEPVTLYNYGLVSRHGTPKIEGFYILHEGLIGVLDGKLREITYADVDGKPAQTVKTKGGWLGITDKYWAAVLVPDPSQSMTARFSAAGATLKTYQTDFLLDPATIAPGAKIAVQHRLFAGAKEVSIVDRYEKELGIPRFDLLIDWGWFYFITKPMFQVLDYFYRLVGNFGVAILIVTILIKIVFFPLANKSYASMAKMKAVQPMMEDIRKRFPDDKVKQQQAMMELYRQEKINPLAGCLPIVVQIPVFFALYKVLFVTIEMRHAPFFGWIKDLSAPDPTNIFNLFGLIPFDPTIIPVIGPFLHLGVWPLIMGVTMWVQMKLNPSPPDPTQKMIFDWMPIFFTFMLASFSAGLVIYWAWNNTLSVLQQAVIMKKHGAKIELLDNIAALFKSKKPQPPPT